MDMSDWNAGIIEEFRANEGRVGGPFEGGDLLLLHTTGARTGQPRVNPLAYAKDGDDLVIAASKAGAPDNPDWFHNIVAHPDLQVEVGTETLDAHATIHPSGPERDRLYALIVAKMPGFGDYETKTTRTIPVVTLSLTR
jgi:deazaflavin-dependent oxidoreductase (nitroreductase family)